MEINIHNYSTCQVSECLVTVNDIDYWADVTHKNGVLLKITYRTIKPPTLLDKKVSERIAHHLNLAQ